MKPLLNPSFLFLSALLILSVSFTSCTKNETGKSDSQPDEPKQAIEQSVSNDGNDSASENASASIVRFEREQIFGTTDDILVGVFNAIAVDSLNRVYIADSDQKKIHVFHGDGTFIMSLGREGRGPGEFFGIRRDTYITTDQGRLYVPDGDTRFPHRVHVFLLEDLSFSHTFILVADNKDDYAEDLDGYYATRVYPLKSGNFLIPYRRAEYAYRDQTSFIRYVIQNSERTILDGPVLEQQDQKNLTTEVKTVYKSEILEYTAIHSFPFFGKSILLVSNGNIIYAVNQTEQFRIDAYSINGEHIRTIEHAYVNVSFRKDEVVDRYERTNYKEELGDGVAVKMVEEAEKLPNSWPAIQEMLIDSDNRLWVSTIVDDFDVYEWWVLEETGEIITKFEWPRDEPIEVIKNGKMYTRETDEETGLEKVVRYRVVME